MRRYLPDQIRAAVRPLRLGRLDRRFSGRRPWLPRRAADGVLRWHSSSPTSGRSSTMAAGRGTYCAASTLRSSRASASRWAVAVVMAGRAGDGRMPGLVGLDEPTRGMDRARREELARWAGGLADGGASVVIATHDVEFASVFAERVVLLGDGELIADGP